MTSASWHSCCNKNVRENIAEAPSTTLEFILISKGGWWWGGDGEGSKESYYHYITCY